ncbi:MAG: hypothetical protein EOP45_19360, partial [Sphingobacteriaceae bacterium]
MVVTCLRWAIDSGMGIILPRIAIRSETNLLLFDQWADLGFLYDEEYLKAILKTECPQLQIYSSTFQTNQHILVQREPTPPWYSYRSGEYHSFITELLHSLHKYPNSTNSIAIWETQVLFSWNFTDDPILVHKTLMDAVIFSPHIRSIGQKVYQGIKDQYLGFHLRCESDWDATSYESQLTYFLEFINKYPSISSVYIAVGSKDIEEKFQKDVKNLSLSVFDKWSLVKNNSILQNEMSLLGFDQLAAIDYLILFNSEYFMGTGLSSFSYGIAWDRGNGTLEDCRCQLNYGIN